ncbi:MAG: HAD-IC family P-type ATPase [Nodosilinea sp.]
MTDWHTLDIPAVLQQLDTTPGTGLKSAEVAQRQQRYGLNQLLERPTKSLGWMLWEQLTATTVLVLIAAAAIAAVLGDYKDTIAILAIVIFNAGLGLNQEYRASQAFAALRQLAVPLAKVCRDREWRPISARQLVPGDLIRLEAGDFVPADCRLIESANLQVQESAFTGEFAPVSKNSQWLAPEGLCLADRQNMVYLGTVVTYGRGQGVVTATGMTTELGQIAQAVQTLVPEPTPLQKRLDSLGKRLAIATLLLVLVILGLGLLRGENFYMMVLTAVSIAVAVIPEGLPAVVTITLALGARRMLSRQALIRKLPAVETLGAVTTICADKTGTLTENRMTVVMLEVAG